MHRFLFCTALLLVSIQEVVRAQEYADLDAAPHHYWEAKPRDRFSKLADELESGRRQLPRGDDLTVLRGLLDALDIPVSSQRLVFSATSLQSGLINIRNPRAIYANDDTSVGYVPGGRLEILSIDPELGAIFYIFNVPKDNNLPFIDRSTKCMNCHQGERMNFIPGHALESTIPSMSGGSLEAFRRGKFGHGVPLEDRLGGWHVTGEGSIKKHHGNVVGKLSPQGLKTTFYKPGEQANLDRYPVATSDMLAHLIHEHQTGFINMVLEGTYRARFALHQSGGNLTPEQLSTLDVHAQKLVRYVLFADEVSLPAGGIPGDPEYKKAFQAHDRHALATGASLRDLDLRSRMFRYRCSYMIHTELWDAMPPPLMERVQHHLRLALNEKQPSREYAYLDPQEKRTIRAILTQSKGIKFE